MRGFSHPGDLGRVVAVGAIVLFAMLWQAAPSHAHALVDPPIPPGSVSQPLPATAVARVGTSLVRRRTYRHWFRVAAEGKRVRPGSRRHARLRREVVLFLIQTTWVRLEARDHGVTASRRAVLRRFRANKRAAFETERAYRRFLRESPETEADLLLRVKSDLLQQRLSRHVTAGAVGAVDEQEALDRFTKAFRAKWRARTACARTYLIAECAPAVVSSRAGNPPRQDARLRGA